MDRQTRKELKTDKFTEGVGTGFEFLSEHRSQATRWGLIGVAVVVLVGGIWAYRSHQATVRTEALAKALQIDDASIGPPQPPHLSFPTVGDRDKARLAAFSDVAAKYPGTQEGAIAKLAVASAQSDGGQIDDAVKTFQSIADSSPAPYDSVGKLSLAQIYTSQGKTDEAEKLLRQLVDKPSVFVSKEQATLALAQAIAKKNPTEARKLLTELSASPRSVVSRAAVAELGTIAPGSTPAQSN